MSVSLQRLLPLFERERSAGRALALATVVRTAGPTYTKPGALMVIASDGEYAGLLSGGCLEGDLSEHGRAVLGDGVARLVRYDMRSADDVLFGLGSGCEGAMDILLQRVDEENAWQPLARLAEGWSRQQRENLLIVVNSTHASLPRGAAWFAGDLKPCATAASPSPEQARQFAALGAQLCSAGASRYLPRALPGIDLLAFVQPPPPRVLLLGAGPDALPVAELAGFLGWSLTVIDHRPHYARAERFPGAAAVLDGGASRAAQLLREAPRFDAAIVMNHHLASDLAYLRALAASAVPYVGLLGPVIRRERLLADLGADAAQRLRPRLHAPIGLDLGADSPEAIALSIVAEIHGVLAGRGTASSLSEELRVTNA